MEAVRLALMGLLILPDCPRGYVLPTHSNSLGILRQ